MRRRRHRIRTTPFSFEGYLPDKLYKMPDYPFANRVYAMDEARCAVLSGDGSNGSVQYSDIEYILKATKGFLRSIPALQKEEGLEELVDKMICNPNFSEKQYTVHRIPKKSGGVRVIEAPSPLLKKVQRCILEAYLYPFMAVSFYAMGFVPKRSIALNAESHFSYIHKNQQVLLKMDMHDFFPSVDMDAVLAGVYNFIRYLGYGRYAVPIPPGFPDRDALITADSPKRRVRFWGLVDTYKPASCSQSHVITCSLMRLAYGLLKMCMLEERLPQGAPTSPALSNIALMRMDNTIASTFMRTNLRLRYTRYADDMIVSTNNVTSALFAKKLITSVVNRSGFLVINNEKTQILRNHVPQKVTGININDKVSISRWKRDDVRAQMHNLITGKHELAPNQFSQISGHRAFMRGVDKEGWDSRCEPLYQQLKEKIKREVS